MRRSAAPSSRHGQNVPSSSLSSTGKHTVTDNIHTDPPFPNAARSTASVLSLLNIEPEESENQGYSETEQLSRSTIGRTNGNFVENLKVISSHLQEDRGSNQLCDKRKGVQTKTVPQQNVTSVMEEDKRKFNVVWGKQSTKKHKTWEGDGILEVSEKTAVLKDTDGKIMGRASGIKTSTLEEGSRLFVGSKEVEIIDLVKTSEMVTCSNTKQAPELNIQLVKQRVYKRPKTTPGFSVPVQKPARKSTHLDYKTLLMPQPSHEHQWEWNPTRRTVVDVSIDPVLVRVLRPHQREGVVFLYECIMGMREMHSHGAILADEMGLGKTLQCITLVWTLLKKGPYGGQPVLKRVLIITPSSLVANWKKEFLCWLGRERIQVFVVDQKHKPKDYKAVPQVPVVLISYEMFTRGIKDIEDVQFDLLICDEGHRLKNSTIKISTLLMQLKCKRKILLTGTPIQNDLQEFYSLANFVNPGVLGTNLEFRRQYEDPIVASRQPDASEEVKSSGEQRTVELNHCTSWFILRRTQEVIDKYLPTKQETVVFCSTSSLQRQLYSAAVSYWENREELASSTDIVPHLSVITALKKICNHPALALNVTEDGSENVSQFLAQTFRIREIGLSVEHSGKLTVVMSLLQELRHTKEKVLLVSYFTQTLDLLTSICEHQGYKCCRLDGSTPTSQRQTIVDNFNKPYSDTFVFLLSARAGGVGLNLTGASRLLLYDSDWNPATDLQAMSRIWRDGQKRSVHIYRLLTTGTIEEKIFQRQVCKTGLSGAIVDPQNNSTIRLSDEELKDLFTLHVDQECLTHSLLDCQCSGIGEIPGDPTEKQKADEYGDQRDCQLQTAQWISTSLRMNQLLKWEHHSQPFKPDLLQEMGFSQVAHLITYIFRNSVHLKAKDNSKTY